MKNHFDYLVVGAGLFGSTFARFAADFGKKCLILEKRNHIGGNCYTEVVEGINVHKYGAHIFHTNNEKIWNFINRFSKFNNYRHKVKTNFNDKIYSFPINLMTLNQLFGIKTPKEAKSYFESNKIKIKNPKNLEDWALSKIGNDLYEIFIKGYTKKQWEKNPSELPKSIIKRLPIRLTFNDDYFNDFYQGIPVNGYTKIFENMLDHENIKLIVGVDFFSNKKEFLNLSKKTVFTGNIDQFYDFKFGKLEYRSLKFEQKILNGDFQGNSIVNYTSETVPFTRIIEHKHFENKNSKKTIVTYEYPDFYDEYKIPFYPINDKKNNDIYNKYKKINSNGVVFGGRLGNYRYMDMHQVIGSAMVFAKKELNI